ncbi:hypothetical protein WOLCODRAFT_15971 [Wolfiporia cocos MD-104 SS10]|uniref:Uncharacterized protein n=1 Tax=Wolfiporia cocos (strain MD-104) TaxID=742152 RepID=A0A2H3JAK3_WOLCO|nr:hypothetical protein WOLCODRAFT_15971 [Wolfiporia cocos MD-104 SS10]
MVYEAACIFLKLITLSLGLPILLGHTFLESLMPATFHGLTFPSSIALGQIGGACMLYAFSLATAILSLVGNGWTRAAHTRRRRSAATNSTEQRTALFVCGLVAGALGPILVTTYSYSQGLRYNEIIEAALQAFVHKTTIQPEEAAIAAVVGYTIVYVCARVEGVELM